MKEQFLHLIENQKLSHAYLFEGDNEVVTSFSQWLTQAYFCKDGKACGECSTCRRVYSSNHPDVHTIAPEGRNIKIDQVRELLSEAAYMGLEGSKKVFIIKEADKLNVQSANALLKFIEEPSHNTLIMLLCSSSDSILKTILSRVQVVKFKPGNTLERTARSKGINLPSLPIYATFMSSYMEYETIVDVSEDWVTLVKNTMEANRLQAIFKVECEWDKVFDHQNYKMIIIQLINSYVKSLWQAKKGQLNAWNLKNPKFSWAKLILMQNAADELLRGYYSNQHYILGLENFFLIINEKQTSHS